MHQLARSTWISTLPLFLLVVGSASAQESGFGEVALSEPPAIAYLTGTTLGGPSQGGTNGYAIQISGLEPIAVTVKGDGWVEKTYSGGTFEVVRCRDGVTPDPAENEGARVGAGHFLAFRTLVHPTSGEGTFAAKMEFSESGPIGRAGGIAKLSGFLTPPVPMPVSNHAPWTAMLIFEEVVATTERSWGLIKSSFR